MGKNVLISLVSDQTIPNVLIIKELAEKYDSFVFVSSDTMEKRGKTQTLVNTCKISSKNILILKVDQDNYKNTIEILQKGNFPQTAEHHYLLNITCGTKLMSIALLDYFKDYPNKEVVYLPHGSNDFVEIYKNVKTSINTRLTIDEYLSSYDIKIKNENKLEQIIGSIYTRKDKTYILWDFALNNLNIINQTTDSLRKIYYDNKRKITAQEIKNAAGLVLEVIDVDILNETEKAVKEWYNYLTGGWFEELVFLKVKNLLNLNDVTHLCQSLIINKGGTENELDVVVSYENRLFYIECKTGLGDKPNDVFKETFDKLARMKDQRQFGLSMNNYLLSLDEKVLYDQKTGTLKDEYKQREIVYGLKFYGFKEILEKGIDTILKEIFGLK